jgi:hypothetical protein
MALYLTCGLCGRKQADGLLSRNAWGHLEGTPHGPLRACPTCKERDENWQARLLERAVPGATLTRSP